MGRGTVECDQLMRLVTALNMRVSMSERIMCECWHVAWHAAQAVAVTGQLPSCPSGQQVNAALRHMPWHGMQGSALNPNP